MRRFHFILKVRGLGYPDEYIALLIRQRGDHQAEGIRLPWEKYVPSEPAPFFQRAKKWKQQNIPRRP